MASRLVRLGMLAALGAAALLGPGTPAGAAEKAANAAAAEAGAGRARGPGSPRETSVTPPPRPILGTNLMPIPGEQCADIRRGRSEDSRPIASCERRPRGHGRDRRRPD